MRYSAAHSRACGTVLLLERGGPRCSDTPRQNGFGLNLVRGVTEHDLHGSAHMDFQVEGLVCRLRAPLTRKP